jgi:hypothetical protein
MVIGREHTSPGVGPMDEHAPRDDSESSAETYQPSDKEESAIRLATKLFNRYKRHKARYDEPWLDRYKIFRGKQWSESRPSYRHTEVFNKVFQAIQSQVPEMVDTRPRVAFNAAEPNDEEFAELVDSMFRADWEKFSWFMELVEMLFDGEIYGTGLLHLDHDPDADYGLGRLRLESYDPFYFFPDNNARDTNKRCEGIVTAEPTDTDLVKKQHPKQAKYIKSDVYDLMHGSKTDFGKIKFRSPIDQRTVVEGSSMEEWSHENKTLVITLLYKPIDEVEEHDKESGKYVQKRKYPNGRTIKIASGVLLEDKDSLPHCLDTFPFVRWVNYILPREFWGISEIEQLESPQKVFNKIVCFVLDILTLMGNPCWLVDTESDVDTDSITNRPGLIIEKAKDSEVRRVDGIDVPGNVFGLIDRVARWFDGISGETDVTQGVQPGGVTAARAIEALQSSARTRIRQKMRNMNITLTQLGELYVQMCLYHYNAPRVFRITGQDGAAKYFKVHMTEKEITDPKTKKKRTVKVAQVIDYEKDPTGKTIVEKPMRELMLSGSLDVTASAGSGLPFAKAEKEDKLLRYWERGIIDTEELLRETEYPNYQAVMKRVGNIVSEAAHQRGAPPA